MIFPPEMSDEPRELMEAFLKAHDAESTVFIVENKSDHYDKRFELQWNHLRQFDSDSWATLVLTAWRDMPWEWKLLIHDNPLCYVVQTEVGEIVRSEFVAEFLGRFRA